MQCNTSFDGPIKKSLCNYLGNNFFIGITHDNIFKFNTKIKLILRHFFLLYSKVLRFSTKKKIFKCFMFIFDYLMY